LSNRHVSVIGGGLAGCEAAFQLAARGVPVVLHEMRPVQAAPAHHTDMLAELVCSNSLKSDDPRSAPGMLKRELADLGSLLLACARAAAVPAGAALAVDRERFSALVTDALAGLGNVEIVRGEVTELPDGPVIVATGPLTSPGFEDALAGLVGSDRLAFYDAAAPIVEADSIDRERCFAQSRYDKGTGADYLNCPMDRDQYEAFVAALTTAERVGAKPFEAKELFQACQPAEEIARRGPDALRFGAFKPVGLTDPSTGRRPYAVLQLRAENAAGSAYNLVGCQTSLTFGEQARVFRMVPGLEHAEFLRFGVVHRNTFVDAPRLLAPDLALRREPRVRLAGQITGTEGYLEAVASGLLAGLGTYAALEGLEAPRLPGDTAFGALIAYATDPSTEPYQPMHVNFGLMPPLDPPVRGKRDRHAAFAARGASTLAVWLEARSDLRIADVARMAADLVGAAA
jgi:methylenetetrahydrofolate--tRNA-(uracil-5-)-methyltransferase